MASVRDIQTALSSKGFDPGGIDGIWGRNTIKAVRAFQSANGLAFNAAVRLDNHVQVNAGFGYGADQNLVGGRVGLRLGW